MLAKHFAAPALTTTAGTAGFPDRRRCSRLARRRSRFIRRGLRPLGPQGPARRAGRRRCWSRRRRRWRCEDGAATDAETVIPGTERATLGALSLVRRRRCNRRAHRCLWRRRCGLGCRRQLPAVLVLRRRKNNRWRRRPGAGARGCFFALPSEVRLGFLGGERDLRDTRRGRRRDCSRLVRHQPMATVAAEGQLGVVVRAADVTRCHGQRGPSRGG